MSPDSKKRAAARLHSSRAGIFGRGWAREKLVQVRDLVRRALELVEANGGAPDAAAQLRVSLAEINAELSARGRKRHS